MINRSPFISRGMRFTRHALVNIARGSAAALVLAGCDMPAPRQAEPAAGSEDHARPAAATAPPESARAFEPLTIPFEPIDITSVFSVDGPDRCSFKLFARDSDGDGVTAQPVHDMRVTDSGLTVRHGDFQVDFSVQSRGSYLVLRVTNFVEPAAATFGNLTLSAGKGRHEFVPLNYMVSMHRGNPKAIDIPWLWAEGTSNASPAFAIHAPVSDEEHDENLLRMWVYDGLPHPPGDWTLEAARAWLTDWQQRFADQSCLVVSAKNLDELDTMTGWAEKIGMKRIYLHTDTWRGEYWPYRYSYINVNTNVFPRGETDLNAYTTRLRGNGMSFAVHSTVMSIAKNDPDYALDRIHPGLARWVRGVLTRDADGSTRTIHFRPDAGFTDIRKPGAGRYTLPPYMNTSYFLIGGELVQAGDVDTSNPDEWVLRHCRRGGSSHAAAEHEAGAAVDGMLTGYGQCFMPDSDTPLFDETIQRWVDFCYRNNVDHLECDALEIHHDKPWGPAKFSYLLASKARFPCTSNTSGGSPLPFHVEYWFRGSRDVMNNHARAGAAGGASTPLYLHSDVRPATGPYEILFKPAQMIAQGGRSFNISYPWPMFGVTTEILDKHGMVPKVEQMIADWRTLLPGITPAQQHILSDSFSPYRGAAGRGNQAASDVLYRPVVEDHASRIVPLRVVGRADGELNWGYGQEFGPIVPRQYLPLGDVLNLRNSFDAQPPEFVIRVMGAPSEAFSAQQREQSDPGVEDAILAAYKAGTTTSQTAHPLGTASHIWPQAMISKGEAAPGTAGFRYSFTINDPSAVRHARIYFQVDDEAAIFLNGDKIFDGGKFNRVLFVELKNLRRGKNTISAETRNFGGPGCFTAALHYEEGGRHVIAATGGEWQGRAADGTWGPVTELAAFGESVWPAARPELAFLRTDLMPQDADIEQAEGHTLDMDGDAVRISCRNSTDATAVHIEDRPAWPTSMNMSDARGLVCELTGDGSGAVLVITLEGSGSRDYVIPMDFTGARRVVIPDGQVAWSHPKWGWRFHSARYDYSRVRRVRIGFGTVPPGTEARAVIHSIRPVRMADTAIENLTIQLRGGRGLMVPGMTPSGHYLWYLGGDTVGLYDLNWNHIRDIEVRMEDFVFPAGEFPVRIVGRASGMPWLEVQFFTRGEAMEVSLREAEARHP